METTRSKEGKCYYTRSVLKYSTLERHAKKTMIPRHLMDEKYIMAARKEIKSYKWKRIC